MRRASNLHTQFREFGLENAPLGILFACRFQGLFKRKGTGNQEIRHANKDERQNWTKARGTEKEINLDARHCTKYIYIYISPYLILYEISVINITTSTLQMQKLKLR